MRPLTLLLALLVCAGCDKAAKPAPETTRPDAVVCAPGDHLRWEGELFCVYPVAIIEEGFRCPPEKPTRIDLEDQLVCTDRRELPPGLLELLEGVEELDAGPADAGEAAEEDTGPVDAEQDTADADLDEPDDAESDAPDVPDAMDATPDAADADADDVADADVPGLVINGCRIEPGTQCPGVHLAGETFDSLPRVLLTDAVLTEANLAGAALSGADLRGVDLRGAILDDADLAGADLTGADLTGASMQGTVLMGAIFTDADLSGANLWAASLSMTVVSGATLNDASLRAADLTGARFVEVQATRLDLRDVMASNMVWEQTVASVAIIEEGFLEGGEMIDVDLSRARVSDSDLTGVTLTRVNLAAATFVSTDLTGAILDDTDLGEAFLRAVTCPDGTQSEDNEQACP